MSFIGIINELKNEKNICELLGNKVDVNNIIFITEKNIENIKNVKFEVIILNKEIKNKDILKKILSKVEYLIVNTDIEENLSILENLNVKIITYGFNSKSTVTASSVLDEEILLCIQRSFENVNGNKVEVQEINIKTDSKLTVYEEIFIKCFFLIYNENHITNNV